jgi:DNA-binding Lrp family transcriptional regulator
MTLDRTDIRILDILQKDGRLSNIKLAEMVNLSPTAALARVQKLSKDGFILGYEAKLNPDLLNKSFVVFVEILLDKTTPNVLEEFTDAVVRTLNERREHLVFILWGAYAQKKGAFINRNRHLVLTSAHPSPLSAYNGFFGNHHFSRTNDYLLANGETPIEW